MQAGQSYIATEHLLLGIVRDEESNGVKVLKKLNTMMTFMSLNIS